MKMNLTERKNVFAKRFDDLLEDRGYSNDVEFVDEFTKYVGEQLISGATVSNYRHANRFPSLERLIEIANFFGVSLDYLIGESDCKKSETQDIHKELGLSEEAINYLVGYVQFPDNLGLLFTDFINMFLSDPLFMDSNKNSILDYFWRCMIKIRTSMYLLECVKSGIIDPPELDPNEKTHYSKDLKNKPLKEILSKKEKDVLSLMLTNAMKKNTLEEYESTINNTINDLSESIKKYFSNAIKEFVKQIDNNRYDGMLPKHKNIIDLEIVKLENEIHYLKETELNHKEKEKEQ